MCYVRYLQETFRILAKTIARLQRHFYWPGTTSDVNHFYPRDAMLARVFGIATCLSVRPSVRPSVRLSHAGIVPSRAKAGS